MGLDKAKSLLEVKGGSAFLDLTARQVVSMRKKFKSPVKFMLMNSFNTSTDTLNFLAKYPSIAEDPTIELVQNKVPKIDKATNAPATWAINPNNEVFFPPYLSCPHLALPLEYNPFLNTHISSSAGSGVLPATEICTPHFMALASLMSYLPRESSICSSPTRTILVLLSMSIFSRTSLLRTFPSSWSAASAQVS